jgi:septal ring factor EnvC (AmiA/AmiB activator)
LLIFVGVLFKETPKELLKNQAKISASKTDAEALTTDSSAIVSQISEVSNQIMALWPQSVALSRQWDDVVSQDCHQKGQFAELKTQSNVPNAVSDVLKNQLRARTTRLNELLMEKLDLSKERSRFNNRLAYKISTGNCDFSDLWNDIAAHKTELTAWKAKLTAFQNDITIPILVEHAEAFSVSESLQPNSNEPESKCME